MQIHLKNFHRGIITKVALALAIAFAGTQVQAGQNSFRMVAVTDEAEGRAVVARDFDKAIARIQQDATDEFAVWTNLCVAYTLTDAAEQAASACDRALALAEARFDRKSRFTMDVDRRDFAVALSNRGVLRAALGDLDSARVDFDRAVEVRSVLREPVQNAKRLSLMLGS